jgi:succinyl-CoA synthetase beta subunit
VNIHEFQARQLLAQYGVALPAAEVFNEAGAARQFAEQLFARGESLVVVKAQIHAGGRGKGTFKNGFKGGVRLCKTAAGVFDDATAMLGNVLVTKQTGPAGRLVGKILVRALSRPILMVSTEGGMDIEQVALENPEKIVKETVNPAFGLLPFQGRKLSSALGLTGDLIAAGAKFFSGVFKTFWECDASLVEINPLCIIAGRDGKDALLAVDAKISLDDNALYRHANIQAMRDLAEEAPLEIEAGKYNLNYIKLDGSIACLVNGAGLAMATMDIIQHYGGQASNFLDVGGGASKEQVTAAFRIILSDPNVKAILVNIFGGIMQCDIIATGIVAAVKETQLNLPLVVRLEGNNVQLGKKILQDSGLPIINGDSMADAAQKVVQAVEK